MCYYLDCGDMFCAVNICCKNIQNFHGLTGLRAFLTSVMMVPG